MTACKIFSMRLFCLFLIWALWISGVSAFQITEVYPDTFLNGDTDEYLVISGQGPISTLEVTDGEGTLQFPSGSVSGGSITIARDGEAFRKITGKYPDYDLIGKSSSVAKPHITGKFQLANQKDELTLILNGQVIQNLTWPGSFSPRKGQIHVLSREGIWDSRVYISGQSRFESTSFANISGVAFVSPDCSRSVFEDAITSAHHEILVNIYEFTDQGFADLLCAAAARGVRIIVLIEGGPVGGISPDEQSVIATLSGSNIQVSAMTGAGEDHAPYRYDHAKYLVIDGERVLLTTENFTSHSIPHIGTSGNRGWGVFLTSRELAGYFSQVFASDLDGPGITRVQGYPSEITPYTGVSYNQVFEPVSFTAALVTPVLAPDTTDLIVPFISKAKKRVLIEEAYIKHWTGGKKNPYLQAAIDAARRGVDVRIILDSFYYNDEDEADNADIVDEINGVADRDHLPLEARMIDLRSTGLLKLHAKGVVADDSVFISSINWNENSPVFNREAGLIIEDKSAAGYFASVFESDWKGGRVYEVPSAKKGPDMMKIGLASAIIIFLIVVYWRRQWQR
ncbi:MAG: phospholipase D-like domain-containing protein [Methanobacteriota archaeon]